MKILKNAPFDTLNYCGKIVITYAQEDEHLWNNLFERLLENGIKFAKNPLSDNALSQPNYQNEIEQLITESACYIIAGSKNLFENVIFKKNVMYQAGFAEDSIKLSKIIPDGVGQKVIIINVDESLDVAENLKGTPYENSQNINKIVNVESLILTLNRGFILEKYDFYDNKEVNKLVTSRMKYHQIDIEIPLNIEILKRVRPDLNSEELRAIFEELSCGIHILQFGYGIPRMTSIIYKDEYVVGCENKIFPGTMASYNLKKTIVTTLDDNNEISAAKLVLQFLIPLHIPLGTTYKAFVKTDSRSYQLLKALLQDDFAKQNTDEIDLFEDKENNRIYFNFDFGDDKLNLRETRDGWNVGKVVEYCFPE